MQTSRKIVSMGLASCLLFTGVQAPLAAELLESEAEVTSLLEKEVGQYTITNTEIKEENEHVLVDITSPVFKGLADTNYQAKLNEVIHKQALQARDEIEAMAAEGATEAEQADYEFRPYQLHIDYEVKTAGTIISVIVSTYTYTGGANGFESKEYYIFVNKPQTQSLQLEDLFQDGEEYISVVNKAIEDAITEQEQEEDGKVFFEGELGFQTISADQGFYLDNKELVIAFGKYEIAPGAMGLPEFRFPLTQFAEILNPVLAEELITDSPEAGGTDNIIQLPEVDELQDEARLEMVSLREVGTQLGYTITWNGTTETAEMMKGPIWTAVKVGKDSYHFGRMAPRPLGKAAELREGRLYVPQAFFTEVLRETLSK